MWFGGNGEVGRNRPRGADIPFPCSNACQDPLTLLRGLSVFCFRDLAALSLDLPLSVKEVLQSVEHSEGALQGGGGGVRMTGKAQH